jgi:hypothetical protein
MRARPGESSVAEYEPVDLWDSDADGRDETWPRPDVGDPRRSVRHEPRGAFGIQLGVCALIGWLVRYWQNHGGTPLIWQDSQAYARSASAGWFSGELWAGKRTPAIPLLLKITSGSGQAMWVQIAIASACWAVLAVVVARQVSPGWRRGCAAAAVLAFSFTKPMTMWDRSVLSETLALAFLALALAAAIWLIEAPSPQRAGLLAGALLLWSTTRDTHLVVIAALALGTGVALLAHRIAWRRAGIVLVASLLLVVGLGSVSAWAGERGEQPLMNVFAVRILPYPARVAWFGRHGMPDARVLGRVAAVAPARGEAPIAAVDLHAPELASWRRWLDRDGNRTLLRWMVDHPAYALFEPFREPERAFNNVGGDLGYYAAPDFRVLPYVTGAFFLPIAACLLAAGLLAVRWLRARALQPLELVGAVAMVLAVPHAVAAWHFDGMETMRHLLVPGVQLRLGLLLAAIPLLDLSRARRTTNASGVVATRTSAVSW